jgi:hypothetical protein
MYEKYTPTELPKDANADSARTRGKVDSRLPVDALVLGIWDGKTAMAVPMSHFVNGTTAAFGEGDWLVLWYGPTKTAAAFRPIAELRKPTTKLGVQGDLAEEKKVTLRTEGLMMADMPFVDAETGSRWDITGRCREGKLKGWTLAPLDAVMVKWFAWVAEYPETTVQGK